jgi:hypothetical protein
LPLALLIVVLTAQAGNGPVHASAFLRAHVSLFGNDLRERVPELRHIGDGTVHEIGGNGTLRNQVGT